MSKDTTRSFWSEDLCPSCGWKGVCLSQKILFINMVFYLTAAFGAIFMNLSGLVEFELSYDLTGWTVFVIANISFFVVPSLAKSHYKCPKCKIVL